MLARLAHHRVRPAVAFRRQSGFTLIELLVVILIIGILAAVAIPAFLNQKGKANDAAAKQLAGSAQRAMETAALNAGGSYTSITTPSQLQALEPQLNTSSTAGSAYLSVANGQSPAGGWTLTTVSVSTGDSFTIVRDADGILTRSCHVASLSSPGGCANPDSSGVGTW